MAKIIFKLRRNFSATQFTHVVCKDELRPAMTGAMLHTERAELAFTDATLLMIYPIEVVRNDAPGFTCSIPLFLFDKKHYFGYKQRFIDMTDFLFVIDTEKERAYVYPSHIGKDLSSTEEEIEFNGYILSVPLIKGNTPNYPAVIPNSDPEKLDSIALSTKLLSRIQKASVSTPAQEWDSRFKFTFYGKHKAVVFEEVNNEKYPIKGLVMPVSE
jgi:hypothetical protein